MARGIRVAKILGIQISVDYTWFIVFIFFAWSLSSGYFPFKSPGYGRLIYVLMGASSALLLFLCVLIHELSHSYTANRLGLNVSNITLFIFGGLASLENDPEKASTEFKIAIAGPVASGLLAALFWGLSAALAGQAPEPMLQVLKYLSFINILLFAFNMVPGFPLDGGRVLRAVWWAWSGDKQKATMVASAIGKGFAFFLIITGVMQLFTGNFTGGLWSILIGVFLQQAAEGEYHHLLIRKSLENVKVAHMMSRDVVAVDGTITIRDAIEEFFLKHHFTSFPVMSGGSVVGILTLKATKAVEKDKWDATAAGEIMHRLSANDFLKPEDSAYDALARIIKSAAGRLPVVEKGVLVGILSRKDLMRIIEIKSGFHKD